MSHVFIKRVHSPIDTFLYFQDFLDKSKLRVVLRKVYFGKFERARKFPKNAQKNAWKVLVKEFVFFFASYKAQFFSSHNFTNKKTLLCVYNKDSIKILKPSLLSAS